MKNTKKQEIYYVTSNAGKFDEVKRYIEANEPTIELVQCAIDLPEPQSLDQKYIAECKAKAAWNTLKKPLIIDDSGVFFEGYRDFPGTMTKFVYHGIGFDGIFALTKKNNKARMNLHLVYCDGEDSMQSFEATCEGKIIQPESFDAPPTLPWDAIFLPNGSSKTYAELRGTPQENKYLYRIVALKRFLAWYKGAQGQAPTASEQATP